MVTEPISTTSGTWPALRLRALIADDHHDTADSTALVLSSAGFETQVAYDGTDALKRVEAWNPHVCVLDIGMPEMDGLEVIWRIRTSAGPNPLIIAVSGWVSGEHERAARDAGCDYFMKKPAEPDHLLRVIKSQLLMWPS